MCCRCSWGEFFFASAESDFFRLDGVQVSLVLAAKPRLSVGLFELFLPLAVCLSRERLRDRLAGMGKLDDLKTTAADTCCEGANDTTRHPTLALFPGLTRPPMADAFHKTKIIASAMFTGHDFYAGACRYV